MEIGPKLIENHKISVILWAQPKNLLDFHKNVSDSDL